MFDPRSHIGETHGVYTIVDTLDEKDKYGHWIYKCECIKCGRIKFSHYGGIAGHRSLSHICNHKRPNGEFVPYVNGKWSNKRIGRIFRKIMSRCYNQNCRDYRWYGERGIGVFGEWRANPFEFEKWAMTNGYADDLTIDRIDPNKDYCPENCRWVTMRDNSKYKSTTTILTVDGVSHTGRDWAKECNLGCNTINKMLKKHPDECVTNFIRARLKNPSKIRESNQTWFNVYGIGVCETQA